MSFLKNEINLVPLHVTPSPLNPFLHWHLKLPSVSVQLLLLSQLCLGSDSVSWTSHSFMLLQLRPEPVNPEYHILEIYYNFTCLRENKLGYILNSVKLLLLLSVKQHCICSFKESIINLLPSLHSQ